jgi:hypothetical protein
MGFGNVGPGVSAGIPLRYADLSPTTPTTPASPASQAGGLTQAGYARSVRLALSGLDTTIGPVRTVPAVLPDGQAVVRVEFTAPSPLGISGS